jgi:hypothetical protein
MTEQISNPVIFYKNVSHFLPFRRSLKGYDVYNSLTIKVELNV